MTGGRSSVAARQTKLRICVVGAGTRFLSGISYYTWRLTTALASSHELSTIVIRRLLPARLYPGRARVGAELTQLAYPQSVNLFNGVDWYWLPSLARALRFLHAQRPQVLIFQWWTGTTLHTYLVLAAAARLLRARVVVEFHEVQDTGEQKVPAAQAFVNLLAPLLMRLCDGYVVHSEYDRPIVTRRYGLAGCPVVTIPHGPFDQHIRPERPQPARMAPDGCCNLLYFGVIRPYKGLEDLVEAFNTILPEQIEGYWLTVVGETWEGWTRPAELIAGSRYRERITFVNRYVTDREAEGFFAGADVVVLPYHRSSASGPLAIAMSHGLPVVVTRVGGLAEAVDGYQGAILVPPGDPERLRAALLQVRALRGKRFEAVHSWDQVVSQYEALLDHIEARKGRGG